MHFFNGGLVTVMYYSFFSRIGVGFGFFLWGFSFRFCSFFVYFFNGGLVDCSGGRLFEDVPFYG